MAQDARARRYLPSFLRWTRVRRSSLRCFFLDIRLRRFLITEPMTPLSRLGYLGLLAGLPLLDAVTLPKLGPPALTGVYPASK